MHGKTSPIVFLFLDMRLVFFLILIAFPAVFWFAEERGADLPASFWFMAIVVLGFLGVSIWLANKKVLVLNEDSVEVRPEMFEDMVTISFNSMQSVQMAKGKAIFTYMDDSGSLQHANLLFGNIRLFMKKEARKALLDCLEAHGVRIT